MNRSDLTWKQSPDSRVIWTSADRDTAAAAKHEGAEVAAYLMGFAVPDASISPDGSLEGITNFQVADRAGRERDIALLTIVAAPEDGLDPDWPPTWENLESAFRPDSTQLVGGMALVPRHIRGRAAPELVSRMRAGDQQPSTLLLLIASLKCQTWEGQAA